MNGDMDPNQQPTVPQPPQPQPQPQPVPATPVFSPQPAQPYEPANPMTPVTPVQPQSYGPAPETNYDPNYLDSIAPAPPRAKFLSGGFGKIFFGLIGVFVIAVSLIIAFSGKDKTADLQQTTVRVTNFVLLTKTEQPYFKSDKLSANNSRFTLILTDAEQNGQSLLDKAGVQKSQYNRTMVASEKKISDDLTSKFEDARLNANLDSDYARTMAAETSKLITLFTTMSKHSAAKAIRDYAKNLATNLVPIQQTFDSYTDDGN